MLYTIIALIPSRLSIPVVPTLVLLFAFMLIIGISIGILSAEAALGGHYKLSYKWGTSGSGNGQFSYPVDITIGPPHRVYVVELDNNRVQKFLQANPCPASTTQIQSGICFVTKWGSFGSGNEQFDQPTGIAVDSSGRVYVADGDESNNRIQIFKGTGVFSKILGSEGSGLGQFKKPSDVAFDPAGRLYVLDRGNSRIQVFQLANPCPAGTTQTQSGVCFVTKWGSYGSGIGQFNTALGITVDSSGRVYVADTINHRIQVFTGNGIPIVVWGSVGSGNGQFNAPENLAVDTSGYVYVADTGNNRIQKFQLANPCTAGTTQIKPGVCLVIKWGSYGSGNEQFKGPTGIVVDSSGLVYVVDHGNNRVQVFYWKTNTEGTGAPSGGTNTPHVP
jgi:sugar lactone lactonase YvrE